MHKCAIIKEDLVSEKFEWGGGRGFGLAVFFGGSFVDLGFASRFGFAGCASAAEVGTQGSPSGARTVPEVASSRASRRTWYRAPDTTYVSNNFFVASSSSSKDGSLSSRPRAAKYSKMSSVLK